MLHDQVNESFDSLRKELSPAWAGIRSPPWKRLRATHLTAFSRYLNDWLYTGRAITLNLRPLTLVGW